MNQTSLSKTIMLILLMLFSLAMTVSPVSAEEGHHKVVIQVSTDDPKTQKIVLNNAVNLQKHFGLDNVTIEIVAYGPGLGIMTAVDQQSDRVKSLAMQDIAFSACANTMAKVEKKSGKKVVLTEGVSIVPSGAARIIELQEQGYAYLRP